MVALPSGTDLANGHAHIGFGSAESGEVVTRSFRLNNTGAVVMRGQRWFFRANPGTPPSPLRCRRHWLRGAATPRWLWRSVRWRLVHAPQSCGSPVTMPMRTRLVDLSATGMMPDITVVHPAGSPRVSGAGEVDFGIRKTAEASAAKTFTIQNEGAAPANGIAVTGTGAAAGDFVVNTAGMASGIAVGGSTTFSVTFNPATSLSRRATLRIASNDRDENPFEVLLRGTGLNASNSLAFVPMGDYPGGTFGSSVWGLSGDGTIVVGNTETSVGQQGLPMDAGPGDDAPAVGREISGRRHFAGRHRHYRSRHHGNRASWYPGP